MQTECIKGVTIRDCAMTNCVYNKEQHCHTPAITVGSACPACDTFESSQGKGGMTGVNGSVGACRKADCQFNQSMECSAPDGIHVGGHASHADCMTYHKR